MLKAPITFYRHSSGLSLLEVMVTLIIVVMILTAVSGILHQTGRQVQICYEQLEQQAQAQHCLDRIIEDLTAATAGPMEIDVQEQNVGWTDTAQLTITTKSGTDKKAKILSRIDWVAVPRYEQDDLILFRREKNEADEQSDYYMPLCENLSSFHVEVQREKDLLKKDEQNKEEEKQYKIRLVNVQITLFRVGQRDLERTVAINRAYCLKRF